MNHMTKDQETKSYDARERFSSKLHMTKRHLAKSRKKLLFASLTKVVSIPTTFFNRLIKYKSVSTVDIFID